MHRATLLWPSPRPQHDAVCVQWHAAALQLQAGKRTWKRPLASLVVTCRIRSTVTLPPSTPWRSGRATHPLASMLAGGWCLRILDMFLLRRTSAPPGMVPLVRVRSGSSVQTESEAELAGERTDHALCHSQAAQGNVLAGALAALSLRVARRGRQWRPSGLWLHGTDLNHARELARNDSHSLTAACAQQDGQRRPTRRVAPHSKR